MDIHAQGMPLYTVRNSVAGERDRLGRWGWRPRQPLPPPMIQATPRCFHPHPGHPVRAPDSGGMPDELPVSSEQTVRICTTLHYFAPLCSDFAARSQPEPSENQCVVLPTTWTHSRSQTVPIRFPISVQFWSGFGSGFQRSPGQAPPETQAPILGHSRLLPLTLAAWRFRPSVCRSRLPRQISKEFKVIQRISKEFKPKYVPPHPPIGPAAAFRLAPTSCACRFPPAAFRLAISFLGNRK